MVTKSKYKPSAGELIDPVENVPVQRDGYRTIEDQVREFERAGEQLEEYRRMAYQYEGPGADLIDSVSLLDDPDVGPADIIAAQRDFNRRKKKEPEKKEKETDAPAGGIAEPDSGS